MPWTEAVRWACNLCSIVCWMALAFVFLCLGATGICLFAIFWEEVAQKRHAKKQVALGPVPKTGLSGLD